MTENRVDTAALLSRIDIVQVIERYVPLTKRGAEYVACCPFHTEETPSFTVSPIKQFYHCFGCKANGDAIKFLQEHQGISFKEAVAALGGECAPSTTPTLPGPARQKASSPWVPVLPAPVAAGDPPKAHIKRGLPQVMWCYRDATGQPLGYVYRFVTSDGGKEVLPVVWARHSVTGAEEWRWMAFPEPRPLMNLDQLALRPDATILLVEGEKCVVAAMAQLPGLLVMCWPGGGKADGKVDWSPLARRKVITWADADAKRVPLTREEKEQGVLQESKPLLPEAEQPGVATMARIRERLVKLGCKVWNVTIPPPGEKADGWDVADAIAEGMTGDALADFIRDRLIPHSSAEGGAPSAQPRRKEKKAAVDAAIDPLLKHFALIYPTTTVWDGLRRKIVRLDALKAAYLEEPVKWWLANPNRRLVQAEDVVFDPAEKHDPETQVNLFSGWQLMPDPSKACDLLQNHLLAMCGDDPRLFDWVIKWLAYPLQHPGAKMRTALVVHGDEGTGKSIFFDVMRMIYGQYSRTVTQLQLQSEYTDWLSQMMFCVAEEVVTRQDMKHHKGLLKNLITNPVVNVSEKYMPLRVEDNHINFVFLSNEMMPMSLDRGDRRYTVIRYDAIHGPEYFKAMGDQIDAGAAAGLYAWLLSVPLGDFTPFTRPYENRARSDLIGLGMLPRERFFVEWQDGLISDIPWGPARVEDVYQAYVQWCKVHGDRFIDNQTLLGTMLGQRMNKKVDRCKPFFYETVEGRRVGNVGEWRGTLVWPNEWSGSKEDLNLAIREFQEGLDRYRKDVRYAIAS